MASPQPAPFLQAPDELAQRLQSWVGLGLLSRAQADRILAVERGEPVAPARRPASILAEALGYVGGVLILVATAVLVGRYWADLGVTGRLAVTFGAFAVLVGVGAVVPAASPAGGRLRAVLWLVAVAVLGFGTGLLADDVWHLGSETVVLVAACETAVVAGVLWWWHRAALQQAGVVAALAVVAAAAAAHLPRDDGEAIGLAVWGVGAVWLLLGWGAVVGPRLAADVLGGAALVVGTIVVVGPAWGSALAIASGVALVAAGVVLRDVALLVVGSLALLIDVPVVTDRWFPDALAAPVALLVVGVLLVVGALVAARRGAFADPGHRGVRTGSRRLAVGSAAAVAVVVAAGVVIVGLA
jgi:Predicted membrane protein (DUF2157)